eukprot:CAMPEP_0197401840 /NCGR_PEP_ID=MMETSP1165-20131217/19099_1 /TAXON_ID=284809 /ORGANISM="Chrysocystis fragilis, Strain CCMP3189" /LENGTH=74 /DNA_ID=CAMNT_0042927963 /DNA_START=9 /DNA_END=230 /DNA_ORIENTATION=-
MNGPACRSSAPTTRRAPCAVASVVADAGMNRDIVDGAVLSVNADCGVACDASGGFPPDLAFSIGVVREDADRVA